MKSRIYYSLYDRLLHRRALAQAFAKVRRARGAPGIDGQSIVDFASHQDEELDHLLQALRTKSYRPLPVKRVMIPKTGGGERALGIPTVRTGSFNKRCWMCSSPSSIQVFTRQVTAIGREEAARTRLRKRRCLCAGTD